jgi:hypothetical protein
MQQQLSSTTQNDIEMKVFIVVENPANRDQN